MCDEEEEDVLWAGSPLHEHLAKQGITGEQVNVQNRERKGQEKHKGKDTQEIR